VKDHITEGPIRIVGHVPDSFAGIIAGGSTPACFPEAGDRVGELGTNDGGSGRVARKRGEALRCRAALLVNRRHLWGSEGKALAPPADGQAEERPGAMRY
jgi:hypothetical protein